MRRIGDDEIVGAAIYLASSPQLYYGARSSSTGDLLYVPFRGSVPGEKQ